MGINRIIIEIIVILAIVALTNFGWQPSKKFVVTLTEEQQKTARNLKEIVRVMASDIGVRNYVHYENLRKTTDYITGRFAALGYTVIREPYTIKGRTFHNIIVKKPGTQPGLPPIIIGAHYDSCFNPGADDNASGVAGILELARLLKDVELKTTLVFVAFVNEEPPFYGTENMGSRVYARRLKENDEQIKAAVVLDLIGYYRDQRYSQRYFLLMGPFYPNRGNFIACIGNFASHSVVKDISFFFRKHTRFPMATLLAPSFMPATNFSDHWSFWKEGFPAVLITDTAFMRSPHYHSKSDTPDTLDYKRMSVMLWGLKEAIAEFADTE